MKFNNLIEAVKAIRETTHKVNSTQNEQTLVWEIRPGFDLKDAKDLTEAIMALGVRRFLEAQSKKTDEQLISAYYRNPITPDRVCGASDGTGKWCCNLVPGHGGGVHRDHVSGRHFVAGGEEVI